MPSGSFFGASESLDDVAGGGVSPRASVAMRHHDDSSAASREPHTIGDVAAGLAAVVRQLDHLTTVVAAQQHSLQQQHQQHGPAEQVCSQQAPGLSLRSDRRAPSDVSFAGLPPAFLGPSSRRASVAPVVRHSPRYAATAAGTQRHNRLLSLVSSSIRSSHNPADTGHAAEEDAAAAVDTPKSATNPLAAASPPSRPTVASRGENSRVVSFAPGISGSTTLAVPQQARDGSRSGSTLPSVLAEALGSRVTSQACPPRQHPPPQQPNSPQKPMSASDSSASASGYVKDGKAGQPAIRDRPRGVPQTHPVMVAADTVFIITSMAAASVPLRSAIVGYDSLSSESKTSFYVFAAITQVCYWAFIVTRLFQQRLDGAWEIVHFLDDIRRDYLAHEFRFDAALAIPIEWIFAGWAPTVFTVLQLRQVLRLGRSAALVRSLNPLVRARRWCLLLNVTGFVLFFLHAGACLFIATDDVPYSTALYWAVTTASSVGYGDVVPRDALGSRSLAMAVMFFGLATVASLTGILTWMISSKDALREKMDAKKQLLASMLAYYEVPWDVQVNVIAAVPTVLDAENSARFKELIEDLPPFVVAQIEGYAKAKALADAIPLFRKCDPEVRLAAAARLVHRLVQANEPLISPGDHGNEMYFLARGAADVIIPDEANGEYVIVGTLRSGAFFGEVALLDENVVRTAFVLPVKPCEVLVLTRRDYQDLAARFSDFERVFDGILRGAADSVDADVSDALRQDPSSGALDPFQA